MGDALEAVREGLAGAYRIERLLGEGGMASVYLAQDQRHDRRVAVKVLRPELALTIGAERFNREIGIAARLNHPHILPLLDSGTLALGGGLSLSAYYVMPFVEGESLRDRLAREGRLSVPVAVALAREIADALDYAHRNGVVHRDVKPENILLTEGHAVVADFGIARALDEAATSSVTLTGQSIGTPAYMSPEQVMGEHELDGRTDQYALGCTLFEMLTGKPPWSGGSATSLLARRLAEPPPSVRTSEPSVPMTVDRALQRCLAREADQRFATAADFAEALASGASTGMNVPLPRRTLTLVAGLGLVAAAAAVSLTRMAGARTDGITTIAIAPPAPDSATAYLSEGMLAAVADLLRRLPQLRITAPSLVAQVQRRQPGLNAEELGQRLKVGAVLTWALDRRGDSLLLNAELLRVPGGALMWSGRYRRSLSDVLALQSEVARAISDSLRLELTGEERATLRRQPTTSASAYELYLRGRRFLTLAVPPGVRGARVLADSAVYYGEKALAIDSGFGRAWGLIADFHNLAAVRGWRTPFGEELDKSIALARQALARDSSSGEAWETIVTPYVFFFDDWVTAGRLLSRGRVLAPTHPGTLRFGAIYLGEVEGKLDSAIASARLSADLDESPAALNTLGDLYMRARQYDSAVAVLRRAIALDSSVLGPRLRLVTTYERLGRYSDAVSERRSWQGEAAAAPFADGLAAAGGAGYQAALKRHLYDRIDSLLTLVGGPRQYPRDTLPPIPETRVALLYGQLGDWKAATDWVLKEYQRRPKRLRLWLTNPDMQGLRMDPRFMALVRREGLEKWLLFPMQPGGAK